MSPTFSSPKSGGVVSRVLPSQPPSLTPFFPVATVFASSSPSTVPSTLPAFHRRHSRRWSRHLLLPAASLLWAFPRRSSWTTYRPDRRVGVSSQSTRAAPESHACVLGKAGASATSGALWGRLVVPGSRACQWLERQHPRHASIPTLPKQSLGTISGVLSPHPFYFSSTQPTITTN